MRLYYITDRSQFSGSESARRGRLLAKIAEAAHCGVDMIQLREKDLSVRELESLAREAMCSVKEHSAKGTHSRSTRLLINSRTDVAITVGADGVHLRSDDIAAGEARVIFAKAGQNAPVIGVSCHEVAEVRSAESHGADFAVFGPVFGKSGSKSTGIRALHEACGKIPSRSLEAPVPAGSMPVLALGGLTLENAAECVRAGAAGIAGIRLFQENDIAIVVQKLRGLVGEARV